MRVFEATHKLVAPAGEEIPVMLVSQKESVRYLVIAPENYEEETFPIYEWHPSEGVTYKGFHLDGLTIADADTKSAPKPVNLKPHKVI